MRTTWKPLSNETKRDDSIELSRFFVFGQSKEKREKIRKLVFLFMTFGLVGLMCGSASGQQAKNIIKLKQTGNCKGCFLLKADLKKAKLKGAKLKGADLKFADLKRANLSEADLRHTNLRNANLRNANLNGADLTGADLKDVKLDGAILCHTTMPDGKKVYSNCKNVNLRETDLKFANPEDGFLSIRFV